MLVERPREVTLQQLVVVDGFGWKVNDEVLNFALFQLVMVEKQRITNNT